MQTNPLSRRKFFGVAGTIAAVGAVAPYVLADDKSGNRLPVVGSGENQYEVIHDWGELPAGQVYGNTHGVAVDGHGNVHIKHTVGKGATVDDAIVVFDADGKFIRSWGPQYKGGAIWVAFEPRRRRGNFYMCDTKRMC